MPCAAEICIADAAHTSVFAGFALGSEFGDQKTHVTAAAGSIGVGRGNVSHAADRAGSTGCSFPSSGLTLLFDLFQARPVLLFSRFPSCPSAFLPLGLFAAAGLADGEEGFHLLLPLGFELGFCFGEFDYRIHSSTLAFPRNKLFGREWGCTVGREGNDGADGEAAVHIKVGGGGRDLGGGRWGVGG